VFAWNFRSLLHHTVCRWRAGW